MWKCVRSAHCRDPVEQYYPMDGHGGLVSAERDLQIYYRPRGLGAISRMGAAAEGSWTWRVWTRRKRQNGRRLVLLLPRCQRLETNN